MSTPIAIVPSDFYVKKILAIIKRERKKRKISQEMMAGVLGISRGSYGHMEQGHTKLSAEDLMIICQHMGIKVLLVEGENILN